MIKSAKSGILALAAVALIGMLATDAEAGLFRGRKARRAPAASCGSCGTTTSSCGSYSSSCGASGCSVAPSSYAPCASGCAVPAAVGSSCPTCTVPAAQ